MRNILLILCTVLLFGCIYDPPHGGYTIINNSDSVIYVYETLTDSIQLSPKLILYDRWMSNSVNLYGRKQDPIDPPDYKINAHTYSDFLLGGTRRNPRINSKDKTIRLFSISENIMRTKQWEEICNKQLYVKKVKLTKEQFEKLDWKYTYNSLVFDTVQLISSLKREYSDINSKLASFRKVKKDLLGQSTEGGVITTFYDNKELKKVITTFYGETGMEVSEYYFNKDSIFYIFKTEHFYNKPINIKGSKIVSTKENSYYLIQNQLIKWIDSNSKSVNISSKEYQIEKNNLLNDIDEAKKLIKE